MQFQSSRGQTLIQKTGLARIVPCGAARQIQHYPAGKGGPRATLGGPPGTGAFAVLGAPMAKRAFFRSRPRPVPRPRAGSFYAF